MNKTTKTLLIIAIVVAVAAGAYYGIHHLLK